MVDAGAGGGTAIAGDGAALVRFGGGAGFATPLPGLPRAATLEGALLLVAGMPACFKSSEAGIEVDGAGIAAVGAGSDRATWRAGSAAGLEFAAAVAFGTGGGVANLATEAVDPPGGALDGVIWVSLVFGVNTGGFCAGGFAAATTASLVLFLCADFARRLRRAISPSERGSAGTEPGLGATVEPDAVGAATLGPDATGSCGALPRGCWWRFARAASARDMGGAFCPAREGAALLFFTGLAAGLSCSLSISANAGLNTELRASCAPSSGLADSGSSRYARSPR